MILMYETTTAGNLWKIFHAEIQGNLDTEYIKVHIGTFLR